MEKINADNKPAVVPPSTRTNANTKIEVIQPITNGNKIVKWYTDNPNPKIGYKNAVEKCNTTCELEEISLPWGYHDFSSNQSKYAWEPLLIM